MKGRLLSALAGTLEERATALHEAGHFVIARALGLPCGRCSIVPGMHEKHGPYSGVVAIAGIEESLEARQATGKIPKKAAIYRAKVVALMAGAEARRQVAGGNLVGDGADMKDVASLMRKARADKSIVKTPTQREQMLARLRSTTIQMVRRHREAILMVRDELIAGKTLSGETIDGLLENAHAYRRQSVHLAERGTGQGGPGWTIGTM